MSNSTINIGEYSPYTLTKETGFFRLYSGQAERSFSAHAMEKSSNSSKILDLTGDHKKILATTPRSFYHFLYDFVGKLSYQLDKDRDVEIIFDKSIMNLEANIGFPKVYVSVLKALDELKIKYRLVDFDGYDCVKVNNFYTLAQFQIDVNYPKSVLNFYSSFIKNKDAKPFRKIFISRSKSGHRGIMKIVPWIGVDNDNRIDNFEELDNYFASLGFEIVFAEQLNSFEDQINLFYEAEIIVGTSGSGLANAIFMQEGTTVVELLTPLIISMPKSILTNSPHDNTRPFNQDDYFVAEEIHHFYSKVAFHKKQKYVSIPNQDRSVSKIKDIINNDPYMKSLMNRS
jgi:Glycosyltransferase 61